MAGKKLGTIFVELGLDSTEFTKGEAKILQQSQSTSLKMEQNWRTLGSHSDLIFNAMKANITNAYNAIANKATSTTAEIIRAEEAKNAKLSALDVQQFGAHTSFIDKMKANWIAASAAIVGAWMLVNKAVAYMDQGAKALQVESSFKIMADSAGVHSESLIASMKAATRETIDDSDLMQKAVKLMTLEYNPEQIVRFSKVVITASQIAGISAAEAYDGLADAIANRMPKALVRMGAVTREQMQIVTKAIKAGADETALYELAMANLEYKQLMLQGTQDSATITMQKFHASIKEATETIGKGLIIAADAAYRSLEFLAGGVMGLVSAYARYRQLVYEALGDEKKAADNREIANAAWETRTALIKKAGEAIFLEGAVGKTASQQSKDDAKAIVDAQVAKLKAIQDASKGAKDVLKAELDGYKKTYEMEAEMADHVAKMKVLAGENELNFALDTIKTKEEARTKEYNSEAAAINNSGILEVVKVAKLKELYAGYSKDWQKLEDQKAEKTVQVNEFMMKARQSYITWDQKQEYDQLESEKHIAGEREKVFSNTWDKIYEYQLLTGEKTKETNAEIIQAMIDDYEETLVGGWKSALLEMRKEQTTWGNVSKSTFKAMSSSMASTFSTVFEDAYKGKLKGLSAYSTAIWDGVRKGFFDIMGKMAANKITLMFESVWTSTGKAVIDLVSKVLGYGMDYLSKSDTPTDYSNIPELPSGWQGGRVSQDNISQYADGGYVGGRANFSGNHPGNDTVPAWLSPGEFVVPRSGVNPDTEKILKYISLFGAVPRYADGGLVVTSEPNRGYWGFSDWANTFTGGVSDIVGGFVEGDPIEGIVKGLSAWNNNPIINAMDKFGTYQGTAPQRLLNFLGLMSDDVYDKNEKYTQDLAHAVGAYYAMAGAQAGTAASQAAAAEMEAATAITADMAGNAAANMAVQQGATDAMVQTAYDAAFDAAMAEAARQGTIETISGVAKSVIKSYAKKWILNEMFKTDMENPEQGQMQINYKGLQDSGAMTGLLAYFDSVAPKTQTFSARNGLDYVPRDNFRANLHEGEAVLNKTDAQEWRGGNNEVLYQIAKNTAKLAKLLDRFDMDGMPQTRTA